MPRYYTNNNNNTGVGLTLFSPTFRANTAPIDLGIVQQTYDKLEQGHHQAIAQAAAYKEAIANLDLNEAEDEWRQNLIASIDNALAENSRFGNAYSAYDDIIKTYGDIKSNPGLIGRLRSQQQYKAYLDELSKSNLTEEQKDYFKEMNPYYYQDKVDNKGRIVGGTSWNPVEKYVDNVDINALISNAIRSIQPDTGSGEELVYRTEDGRWTTNFDESTGIPYFKRGTEYTRVSQEKVMAAIDAAIANTPGAAASLKQDYKIDNWKHGKAPEGTIDSVTDDNGNMLSYGQYLQKRFSGYLHSGTRNNVKTNVSSEAGLGLEYFKYKEDYKSKLKQAAKGLGIGNGSPLEVAIAGAPSNPGASITWKNSQLQAAVGNQFEISGNLRELTDAYKVTFNPNDIDGTFDKLMNTIVSENPKDPNIAIVAKLKDDYQESANKVSQILASNPDDDTKQMIDMSSVIAVGGDLSLVSNDNKYKQEYNKLVNKLWKKFGITDENPEAEVNLDPEFIKKHFPNYQDIGFNIKTKNGKEIVTINKKSYDYLPSISRTLAGLQAVKNNSVTMVDSLISPFYALGKDIVTGEYETAGWNLVNPTASFIIQKLKNRNPLYEIEEFTNKLDEGINGVNNGYQTIVGTDISSLNDITTALSEDLQMQGGKWSDKTAAEKEAEKSVNAAFAVAQGSETTMYAGINGNTMQYVDDGLEKNVLWDFHKFVKSRDTESNPLINNGFDKTSGFNYIRIQVPNKVGQSDDAFDYNMKQLKEIGIDVKPGQYITLAIDNVANSKYKEMLLNSPSIKYNMQLARDFAGGVRTYNNADGSIIDLIDKNNFAYRQNINSLPEVISKDQVINLLTANDKLKELKYRKGLAQVRHEDGKLTEGEEKAIANEIHKYLGSIGIEPTDTRYESYFAQIAKIIDNYKFF